MPTEDPRKYVMAVKLSSKVINHLQKGTARTASICFGKENVCNDIQPPFQFYINILKNSNKHCVYCGLFVCLFDLYFGVMIESWCFMLKMIPSQ